MVVSFLIRRPAGPSGLGRRLLLPLTVLLVAACGNEAGDADRPAAGSQAAGSGDILTSRGCQQCHSVQRLGISAASDIGPDLSDAAINVVNRYGRDLRGFFAQPSGTMQIVLDHQIRLTDAEVDSIISVLTRLAEP
jgi:hypothetical protein